MCKDNCGYCYWEYMNLLMTVDSSSIETCVGVHLIDSMSYVEHL